MRLENRAQFAVKSTLIVGRFPRFRMLVTRQAKPDAIIGDKKKVESKARIPQPGCAAAARIFIVLII